MDAGLNKKAGFGENYYRRYDSNLFRKIFGVKPGILKLLREMASGGNLLDLGCGIGEFLEAAAPHYRVLGLERSWYAAKEASKRSGLKGRLAVGEATGSLPFKPQSLTVVSMMDLVEHLEQPEELIAEAAQLLVPGGILILSTPNPESLGRFIKKNRWAGSRDTTHINVRPPNFWLETVGKNLKVERVFYDGLWDSPYILTDGFWERPVVRGMVGLLQSIVIVFPFLLLNRMGWGSPRLLGENIWIFARKNDQ